MSAVVIKVKKAAVVGGAVSGERRVCVCVCVRVEEGSVAGRVGGGGMVIESTGRLLLSPHV